MLETTHITIHEHGYVKLEDHWGSDQRIVEAARMSTAKGFLGWGDAEHPGDERLLAFLWKNRHTTPFEQAGISVEVQAPIFVFREWHRHRTQSYNEFSARYAQMPNLHYLPAPNRVRGQATTNKQGTAAKGLPEAVVTEFLARIEREQQTIYETYQWAIDNGIAREVARINTPVSRYSKMRASGNLLNWLRFLGLRDHPKAQEEIQAYARAIASIVTDLFPRTAPLVNENPL